MVQRQQATCSIDIIQIAKLARGDKDAALQVVDCCQEGLSPLPSGCTSDVIAAARKILGLGDKPGPKIADCRGFPGFFPGRTSKFIGQCCTGKEESLQNCCEPQRIATKDRRCCKEDEKVEDGNCIKKPPVECPPGRSNNFRHMCREQDSRNTTG